MPHETIRELSKLLMQAVDNGNIWLEYCDSLARIFNAVGTSLVPVDVPRRAFRTVYSSSLNAALAEYQRDRWYNKDYRQRSAPMLIERGYVLDTDIVTQREMDLLPYYKDFLRKYGIGGFVGIHIPTKYGSWCAAVQLPLGKLEPTAEQLSFIPEIRRLTQIAVEKAALSSLAQRFAWSEALRTTGHEAAIVDTNGQLSARSAGLEALLSPFATVEKQILFTDPTQQKLYMKSLSGCFDASLDALLPEPILLKAGKRHVLVDFSRFPSKLVHFFDPPEIIVMFRAVAASETDFSGSLSQRFGLTHAEIELLHELVRGSMIKEAAITLKIKEGTARQRLKSIFRKTGTEAQHQLVAMVYRLSGNNIDKLFSK